MVEVDSVRCALILVPLEATAQSPFMVEMLSWSIVKSGSTETVTFAEVKQTREGHVTQDWSFTVSLLKSAC